MPNKSATARHQNDPEVLDTTVDALGGASPLSLIDSELTLAAATRLARATLTEPPKVARHSARLTGELLKVAAGRSTIEPGKDKRFADPAFEKNPLYRRMAQGYLAWRGSLQSLVGDLELDPKSKLRSEFVTSLVTEAAAPTNNLFGNPAAVREAWRTRGASLRAGARHALHDLRTNGGMPSMVDSRPFTVGENVAATPGAVVFRNEVLELIRYQPTTAKVHARPLLIVPPQINKYYVLDLAPGRSLAEALVAAGQQVFMVSWRNPGPEHREWDLDAYVAAVEEGIDAALALTRQRDLNLLGVCAGGITSAAMLGHLAARGDTRVNAVTFLVTVLDWDVPSTVGTFASGPSVSASINRAQRKGILEGSDLNRMFAWLRPNDLVWNYWVNNYLMGRNPPAFDILAWNGDATNLPAGLHADFLTIASQNALAGGSVEVLGDKVDLGAVTCDAFVVAGMTDHITPWEGCYTTTQLLGGRSEFVLCSSGHIQTLVCPPDNPKSKYFTGEELPPTADEWKAGATERSGSWWGRWFDWLEPRSGNLVAAPRQLGNRAHPVVEAAPGTYVHG
jgi:polyhydroxyalkanoate synthase